MNVSKVVKDQYKKLCRKSWLKCNEDEATLSQKVIRSVELGETIESTDDTKVVRYFNLDFLIMNNEIKRMWIESTEAPVKVSEEEKYIYNEQNEIKENTLSLEDRIKMEEKNITYMNKKIDKAEAKLDKAYDRLDRLNELMEKEVKDKLEAAVM